MINAAVIGLGRWGKSLVTAVQGKTPKLRFVHGVSKEPDDVRAFATQHGFRLSTELDEAIANPEVQAVFLATPHSLHVEQVRAVARAGKPVWCEKPLALTRAEAPSSALVRRSRRTLHTALLNLQAVHEDAVGDLDRALAAGHACHVVGRRQHLGVGVRRRGSQRGGAVAQNVKLDLFGIPARHDGRC